MKDSQNCGACGVDCALGECTGGVCTPISTALELPAGQVASFGELVFVAMGDTKSGKLAAYPVEFTSPPTPAFIEQDVCDAAGFLSVGPKRVYYRPQNGPIDGVFGNPNLCGADHFVYSCDATPSCVKTTHTLPVHMNGVAVVENKDFYFTLPTDNNEMHKTTLTPDGVPSVAESPILQVPSMEGMKSTAFLLSYDPNRKALWWTTYDGCIFRAAITELPLMMTAPCYAKTVPSPRLLVITKNDKFYVGGVTSGIYAFDPAEVAAPAPSFGAPELILLGADNDYVYAFEGGANPSLVALRHGSAEERTRISLPGAMRVDGLDALHSKYVFFTAGGLLYRWRRPVP